MDLNTYFINPGELIFSKKPVIFRTVLGSCVGVVLYDRVKKFGGLVHYLLPESQDRQITTKYGDVALPTLINKFLNSGSHITDLDAHVIGGAFIIFDENEIFFIGDRNIEIAQNILKANQIRVRSTHTGGEKGRRVYYDLSTNTLKVETLDRISIEDLYQR